MGTGQMLLTIGAIVILGGVILNVNTNINNTSSILLNSNVGIEEVTLANTVMQEAESLPFDENTISGSVTATNQLTPASALGQENGDTSDLDDFDDYNGINNEGRLVTDTVAGGIYYIYTRVCYVNRSNLMTDAEARTWNKRLDVWVWNSTTADTVKMRTVYSYWPY